MQAGVRMSERSDCSGEDARARSGTVEGPIVRCIQATDPRTARAPPSQPSHSCAKPAIYGASFCEPEARISRFAAELPVEVRLCSRDVALP